MLASAQCLAASAFQIQSQDKTRLSRSDDCKAELDQFRIDESDNINKNLPLGATPAQVLVLGDPFSEHMFLWLSRCGMPIVQ